MIGEFNFSRGTSNSGVPFPLYQQMNEPVKKEGLWVKTSNKIKNIYLGYETEDIDQTWFELNPFSIDVKNSSVVAIGNDVYIIGGDESSFAKTRILKYNLEDKVSTQLSSIPNQFYKGSAVVVGTDIYVLGGEYASKQNYKYDTLTDTWTKNKDIPYNFYNGSAVVVGNEIHLIGGSSGSSAGLKNHYTYNIETGNYTPLADLPIEFRYNQAAYIDDYIYLFCVGAGNAKTFKYKVSEDVCTETGTIPYSPNSLNSFIATFRQYVYLGFYKAEFNVLLEYDTLTNTFEEFQNLWPSSSFYKCAVVNTDIYIFDSANKKIFKLLLDPTYLPGLYLTFDLHPKEFKRYLIKEMHKAIVHVEAFSEKQKLEYSAYIGDGTSWNLLEGD